ncbi:MAG: class E sortase [Propionibacteriaceae bacterium]
MTDLGDMPTDAEPTDAEPTTPRRALDAEAEAEESAAPADDEQLRASEVAATPEKSRRKRPPLFIAGVLLLCLGLLSCGYFAWEYWGTNITSNAAIKDVKKNLQESWSNPVAGEAADPTPKVDTTFALIRIPALGASYEFPVNAGTTSYALSRGIGWYENTQLPGQVGNFAVAAHRATHTGPFERLLELNPGDKVIVETRDYIYTYELTTSARDLTVTDTDGGWILDPNPGKKEPATEAQITLMTCTDMFASPNRSAAFGRLITVQKK